MKKTIKIFFSVFMSVLIICFSCLTVFADTTVDGSAGLFNKEYFEKRVEKTSYLSSKSFNLSQLPIDDYLTIFSDAYYTDTQYKTVTFIRTTDSYFNYCEEERYYSALGSDLADNEIRFVYLKNEKRVILLTHLKSYSYSFSDNNSRPFVNVLDFSNKNGTVFWFPDNASTQYPYGYFINNEEACNFINTKSNYQSFMANVTRDRPYCEYVPSLFAYFAQIIPGYQGHIVDTSFEGVLSKFGKNCDNSILKQYKYQVTYLKNNDIVMMFLNNNKAPAYEVSDYNGQYDYSKKYKFTYANSYDAVIYFPQYQKYLTYDDWYNNKSEPNDFRWFWEEDKKSFSLISDWTVTFNDTGKPSYSGTRVVLSWDEKNSVDNSSLVTSWETLDTDYLESKGFKKGRPDDQNYPYRVSYYINGVPKASVYFNSKPKLEVVRENDFNAEYKMCLIPNYGYFYLELEDMYLPFDGTMGKYTNKSDIFSNIQNGWYDFLTSCKAELDEDVWLHLFENYRGNDTYYVGSRVFFNWDVSADIGKKPDDKFDYSKVFQDGGKYVDKNGHIHGGSLSNYDDEDLNKWNTNGKDDNSNKDTSSSSDFDFSFEGITAYCKDFWNFMQAALAIFPSFIWLLVGTSIAVLIALRLLGR